MIATTKKYILKKEPIDNYLIGNWIVYVQNVLDENSIDLDEREFRKIMEFCNEHYELGWYHHEIEAEVSSKFK